MPQINCETDLDDVSKIGMLSLNSDTEEQIYAHIRAGFNALMQRSNDIAENSDTFNQTAEQLHSLLDNLTKAPSSSDTTNILTKCLEFIKSHNLFLTQGDIANQLVELLHVNDDDECNKDICQILIESVQPLSEKQEKDLNDLLVRSSTEHLLNLLIEKEILSIGAVETIILSIKVTANDEENNNLHANQLIILAKSFDKYPKLKQKFQGPILDFFKEYDDSEFLAQIFRSVGDKSFFDPINQELQKKFNELSVLLEIERAVNTIRLEKNTSEEIKQKLTELTNKDDVLISQNSYQLLSSLGIILENIDGRYIVLKNNDWLKEIRNLGKDFNKFLQYQEEINPNIVFDYESYLAEILTLEYKLPESIYKNILQSNTYICWKLLGGQNNLSESSTRLLISSLDKYQGGTVDHIQNVSFTIAKLVDKKQLPEESTEQAIKLLTTYIGTPDKHIAENIVYCFRHFASDNIENNSFTEGVYQQYLGSNLEDTTILQGLEYIIDNKGELPTSCISNLVEFSLNDEVNDQDRCYGLKLIGKVINQVTQGDIVKVSKLFNCVNELPDTEYDLQDTLDIGYLVTLEEIQLDKYLAEQGLKVQDTYSTIESIGESYGIFSNRFFESISVQLAGLGQVKSPEEIYQMTMESLRLAAGDSAARPIIPLQEYYTSISGNLLSRETIQAAANVLGVNISIYNYDASIREITSCGEARGERVKIGATNNNYFSLVRDNTNYSVATTDQITISSGESYDEVVPVSAVILKNSIRLLESYAKEYNMLPAESLSSLKLLMDNPLLREDIVNILSYLISVSPDQLDAEILDFITSNEPNLDQIVKFNRSISSIKELLNHPSVESSADQEDENTKSITLELEKILTILEGNSENIISLSQLKELYNLFELILKKEPESFTVILSIIEYCRDTLPLSSGTIDELIDLQKLTFTDQCSLVEYGCRSDKLHNSVEEHFNNNLELIANDINSLVMAVDVIGILSSTADLSPETISNLIKIAKESAHSNKEYILKIIEKQNNVLEDMHFVELEELFPFLKLNSRLLLAKLFVNNSKQVESESSIDAILEELTDSNSSLFSSILPEAAGQVGQIIVKLKSDIDVDDKLSALNEFAALVSDDSDIWYTEIIKTILKLLEHKNLTAKSMEILALAVDASNPEITHKLMQLLKTGIKANNIINECRDIYPDIYSKLSPYLIDRVDIDEDVGIDDSKSLKASLELISYLHEQVQERFPDYHITGLDEIIEYLEPYQGNQQFVDDILIKELIKKAGSLDEYCQLLSLLHGSKVLESVIIKYIASKDISAVTELIENELLSNHIDELFALVSDHSDIEAIKGSIREYAFWLKDNGWSFEGIVKLLSQIYRDDISVTAEILSVLKKYEIGEEESNKQSKTALDITNQYMNGALSSLVDIEKATYEIFSNKFETKYENTGDELLAKVEELNPDFADNFPKYKEMLNKVHDIYQEVDESRSTSISKWNKDDIREWADEIKSNYQNHQQESHNAGSCDIAEMIAVVQRAYKLHTTKQGKEGHNLRDSQIVSLILLLEEYQGISIDPGNKGRLMQIATGEGKSIISASLAAILSLFGRSVDIITSSTVLAVAGYKNAVGFFEILGLSADINTGYGEGSGEKDCYGSDIVYADNLTSQSDLLSNSSHQNYERGTRPLDVVIVDEVDSMLLDGSNKMAKQSSPVPLMEYLSNLMAISWDAYQKSIKPLMLDDDRAIDTACDQIEKLVENCPIPSHLIAYAKHQIPHWAKSLVEADRYWNEDQHYVINVNEDGKKVINPVDNSTGVTEENMVWQNGLHQFLQIKHGLHLGSEGLTSFFISNIAYFKNYQKILGMTGTLGSKSSQEFLQTIYDIDLAFMPTHKDKQLIELPPIVTNTASSHRAAICKNAYLESYHHERAVLIIGKNIQDVKEICEELKNRYGNSVNVVNYSRSEESLYNNQIEQSTLPKTIIVATALAGRGTDIKTNREVEENGGLHVISTFIAKNARDEAQIIGRTARSGNSGTCCSIILDRSYNDIDAPHTGREEHIVAAFKEMRDTREQEYVKESIAEKVPSILAEDELYDKFSQLYQELTDHGEDDNPSGSEKQQRRAKINQLKEDFGIWLQTHSDSDNIEDFLASARDKYNEGRFTNPSYPIIGHVGCGDGAATIEHLRAAISVDDIYNFAAHYYTAQGWLQVGPKGDKEYKAKTIESLFETQNRIAELLSYLGAMNIAIANVDGTIDKENELVRQAAAKLGFFQSFAESLEKAVNVVQTCPSNKEVRVKSAISAESLDPALDDDDTKELSFLGVSSIFEVETYKPRQKWLDTIIVGVCGIAQMAIAALIAIGSLGSGINLAVGVMVEGVKDLYATIKAAANGVAIKFTDYLTEKAISYAVIAAGCGIEKISASSSAAAKGGQAAATKAGTDTVSTTVVKEAASTSTKEALKTELITKVVKKAGVELIKTVAIEHVVDFISEGINDGILGGLESRIEGTIKKSASNALNNNPILLSKDHNIEREQLLQEITQEISKKVKTNRNVHIISSLSSGIFSAVGKHHGIGTALYAAQKIGSVADAASKIEPIMDDMKDVINNVVARTAIRAAERPKGRAYHRENTSGELDEAQVQMRDNMSSQIGSVVASYLMQSIQGKVTAPLVNVAVTAGANKILENYEKNTQEELGILSTALAKKQIESRMHMQEGSGVTDNPENVVAGNGSIMLANDQATLPVIQKETSIEINAADIKPSDESMQQIAAKINQPLYLFEDGVLKASYGKGLNGAIIAVDYDSTQEVYRNLIQKDSDNYRMSQEQVSRSVVYLPDIYSALASGTQGKYTAQDLLQLQQANYNAAIAPSSGYKGVYDFYAPTASSLTASNQTEYVPYVSRYSDGVGVPGNAGPVPIYDVARDYKKGVGQYTDSRVGQVGNDPFDGSAGSVSGAGSFWSRIDLSELSMVQTAHANPGGAAAVAITGGDVMLNMLKLGVGARVAMPETLNVLARAIGQAALPVTAGMIAHNASTQHADDINRYASIANNSDSQVEITAEDRMAANPYGWFDESYAAEASAVNHIAKGRALEREGKIGKAVVQRTMPVLDTETSALLEAIDISSDGPEIADFSTHYRPKSILSTPDQSAELAELSKFPGFSPSMLETLQGSFPDDSQKLEEFSNLPGFTPIHTSFPTVETFPDQSVLSDNLDMSVLLKKYDYFPTQVEWTAPSGTKQTYKVYQRDDIDWDLVRTNPKGPSKYIGKTNREAASKGLAPELSDGSTVNLHHVGQNSRGPLVEVGELTHKKGHRILHQQYGVNKGHPEFPVEHSSRWQTDVSNYWKNRGKDAR